MASEGAANPAGGLAGRMEKALAAAREAALAPGGAAALLEALEEAGGCLAEAGREFRRAEGPPIDLPRALVERWQQELGRLEALVGGALEAVAGWRRTAGLDGGYGEAQARPVPGPVRVDETG